MTATERAAQVEIVMSYLGDPRDPYVCLNDAATEQNIAAAILDAVNEALDKAANLVRIYIPQGREIAVAILALKEKNQ